ncbi:beta-ketoacyl synthase N-terminal-like domain-containing protein [Kamptonema sp. UHCC 0994]|uniref:type I polyketide synthase n=1 Tax=Kamptonema sp. UHCC 0994 TaxID=3031329 RepID=UPI0023B95F7D|nr:beta-ketoacyl synthase N-terminal-like domain-containing protein [Kamptonema sp. UHCC 0994]MDF0552998.1 beta-ketoacyl synthase N-terminal-like domain-containing protein [Kamptonema sp. UHCC 0994]
MNNLPENQVTSIVKKALNKIEELKAELDLLKYAQREPIAIIGMSCRFPGADTPEELWQLLRNGVDAISEIPKTRWDVDKYYDPMPATPNKMYARYAGLLKQIDGFDPDFFRISAREAVSLDPQQRLLLEVSWEALERAGLTGNGLSKQTGVFVGISDCDYRDLIMRNSSELDVYSGSGNCHSTASGRLSYYLGLTGPNLALDTACSSSLVSVALAVKSLRQQDCDLALAGGVQTQLAPDGFIRACRSRMLSPDGRCKTFDVRADGYVRAEGCGMVVLKRLSDAITDKDNILALIRGVAVNHDGYTSGLTVPSGPSQQAVIRQALADGGLHPDKISYIEAHGTGTSLGDPIEMGALGQVFGQRSQPLIIGSVKTNIGHTEAAAGIAGLIKVVLSMQHSEIPPNLHFHQPNPYIDWERSPVIIPTETTPWSTSDRFAGVSSFGFSGTNSHIVLEKAPNIEQPTNDINQTQHILTLSAKTPKALQELAQRYAAQIETYPDVRLADYCFTAHTGRKHFKHRFAVVTESKEQLRLQLAAFARSRGGERQVKSLPKIAFLFTGQGSQYVGMGRELYERQPTFREALDHCDDILRAGAYLDQSLLSILYPEGKSEAIHQTAYTQPALFALEYALAQLWRSWGIKPDVVMGHSVGEYVAACVAGIFSLEDGLKLIATRGRLMQALPQDGAMVSFLVDEARIQEAITPYRDDVSIAAINGPQSVVVSGKRTSVMAIAEQLATVGIKTRQLTVSHAFHSPLMAPMLDEFRQVAASITYHKPMLLLVSNVTGKVAGTEITRPDYWVRHVREAVRFADGVRTLHEQGINIFLEIGPTATLLGMALRSLQEESTAPEGTATCYLPSLRESQNDSQQMLSSLGELYVHGADIDWDAFNRGYQRRKVVLPTYPFQRQRYWLPDSNLAQNPSAQSFELSSASDTLRQAQGTASPQNRGAVSTSLMEYLQEGDIHSLVALLDGDRKLSPAERVALPTILEHLVEEQQRQASLTTNSQTLLQKISQTSHQERYEILKNIIKSEIEPIIGSVPADEQRFSDLGIDSLMAVELRNKLRSTTGLELPVAMVFDYPTIKQLASFLLEKIVPQADQQDVLIESSVTSKQDALVEVQSFALTELGLSPASRPLHLYPWTVRPAVMADVARLSQLEREAYGWIGEEAIAPPKLIADRIDLLNSGDMPWFWVMERNGELGAWQVLQPTSVDPYTYGSWDEVTDQGRLQKTFDPSGRNVYIVAGGSSKHFPTVASYLMTLQTLLMLRETRRDTIFVCLAMPGYAKYHSQTGKSPEEYIALTDEDGIPIDEFIALSVYDWPVLPSFRVLRDGYPPDRDSGGHGVSTVFKLSDFNAAIAETYRRIIRHADALGLERK